jgi:U3 small nucleolar RNA-associated protein 3
LKKEIEMKESHSIRLANANLLKARGLYRKRKNYQGNAKLHNREKFQKKQKLRKNMVKEYESKPEVYGGEVTGIRRDLIRSTKIH